MTKLYELDEVKTAILDICDRFPDQTNPMDGNACLYSDEVNGVTVHCLAGQWFAELGVLPDDTSGLEKRRASQIAPLLNVSLMPDAAEFLDEAQRYADGLHHNTNAQQKWGKVGEAIKNDFLVVAL